MELAFDVLGETHKKPLIILHGFFASSRNWRACAEVLSENYCVYVLNARNHGTSPHHPRMDYPSMAADVRDFIVRHKLSKAVIIGHSMGGKTAMWLALHYPQLISHLIVVDIAPIAYQHSFEPLIRALKSLPLDTLRNRKEAEVWLAPAIPELSYRQFLLQNLQLLEGRYQWRIDLDIFQASGQAIVGFPAVASSTFFEGMALFIAGAQSNYVTPSTLPPLFPQATFEVIANAGHWVHVQQPNAFIQAINTFLTT